MLWNFDQSPQFSTNSRTSTDQTRQHRQLLQCFPVECSSPKIVVLVLLYIRIFHLYDQHGNSIMRATAQNVPENIMEDFANSAISCCDISSLSWQNPFRTFSKDLLKNELEDFSWTDKIMMIGHWPSHIRIWTSHFLYLDVSWPKNAFSKIFHPLRQFFLHQTYFVRTPQ